MTTPVQAGGVFITDFDGTMTEQDFYRIAQQQLTPPETPDYWHEYLAGRLTHFEALQRIFQHIRADEETVMQAARQMELDPHAGTAIRQLQSVGWEVVVASAGCSWYIDRLLAAQGVTVTVHANPGSLDPSRGLYMQAPTTVPYYSPATGIDKTAVVQNAVATHLRVAFAGDGRPDLPASLLVPPVYRFARGWLANALAEAGESFRPFTQWSEIADILVKGM